VSQSVSIVFSARILQKFYSNVAERCKFFVKLKQFVIIVIHAWKLIIEKH